MSAQGTYKADPNDGLRLVDCRIANAVRCLPPENKPLPVEFTQCRPFLQAEIAVMPELTVIVALGKGAHDQVLRALTVRPAGTYPFSHGRLHSLPTGLTLADSYHCSRYNTNTGRLSTEMEPPINSHKRFEMINPSPVPLRRRSAELST